MTDNKVTIDADYFAELYRKAHHESIESVKKLIDERDDLKAKLATSQNYNDVIAAKDREIAAVKDERNRLNAKVNELIKGRDARQAERDKEREKVKELKAKVRDLDEITLNNEKAYRLVEKRLAAAEKCIDECFGMCNKRWNATAEIANRIRAYRETKGDNQ